MNAASALGVLNAQTSLQVVSDGRLASQVQALTPGPPLRDVPPLDGPRDIKLADTLRLLSIATAPLYSGSLLGAYLEWAQLRYLGAFDDMTPDVELSEAAKAVAGNQRRVQSEELGIAFAVHVGLHYLTQGSGWVASVTDVDVALTKGSIQAARQRFNVKSKTGNRPDYILQAYRPGTREHRLLLLECKGTKDPRHSIKQLAHAASQLSSLRVGHDVPPGLAVSSVLSDGRTWVNVLRTPQGQTPHNWTKNRPSPLTVDVNVDALREHPETMLDEDIDVSASDLARAATRDGWAGLSLYAGNEAGYQQWAARAAREKREVRGEPTGNITTESLPDGEPAVGSRMTVQTPFGTVSAFRGLTSSVFEALSGDDPHRVLTAQRGSTPRTTALGDFEDRKVISQGADGSVLTLSLE